MVEKPRLREFLQEAGRTHLGTCSTKLLKAQLFIVRKQNVQVRTCGTQGFKQDFTICHWTIWTVNLPASHFTRSNGLYPPWVTEHRWIFYKTLFLQPFPKCVQNTRLPDSWIKAVNLNCQCQKMLDQAAGTFMTFSYYKHQDAIAHRGH